MSKNNIVLFEPEIPQNTGNIMRTCAGTDTYLHLIKPLGFKIDDASLKEQLLIICPMFILKYMKIGKSLLAKIMEKCIFTRYGLHTPHELKLDNPNEKYYFIIGKESTGIPKEILKQHLDSCIRLPINDKIRSLNISNVAAIAIFEALRQQNYNDLSQFEPETLKGKDWLLK